MSNLLHRYILALFLLTSTYSHAGDLRLSYILGIPDSESSPEKATNLNHRATLSSQFALTYASSASNSFTASIGLGTEYSSYFLPQAAPTSNEEFESKFRFYFARVGYRFTFDSFPNLFLEPGFSLGNGDIVFKRKGGSSKNLKNVRYESMDLKFVFPQLLWQKRIDLMVGFTVSKESARDFSLDGVTYSGNDFKRNSFWQLGFGYHFSGEKTNQK